MIELSYDSAKIWQKWWAENEQMLRETARENWLELPLHLQVEELWPTFEEAYVLGAAQMVKGYISAAEIDVPGWVQDLGIDRH